MHPSCQKLSKQAHHLICQTANPSMTQHFTHKFFWVNIFEKVFKPRVDTNEVVNIARCWIKCLCQLFIWPFTDLKNSTSCEYKNKLAKNRAQLVAMAITMLCRNKCCLSWHKYCLSFGWLEFHHTFYQLIFPHQWRTRYLCLQDPFL